MAVNFPQGSRGILTSDGVITSSGPLNFGSREYVVCNPLSGDITLTINDSASSEFVENRLMFIENKSNIYGVRLVSDSNQYIDTVPPQGLKIIRSNQANPINSVHFDFPKSIENKTGNMLRNGDFHLWARGTSFTTSSGANRLADGWRMFVGSTPPVLSITRNTDIPSSLLMGNFPSQYSLNIQVNTTTSSTTQCLLGNIAEGFIYRQFFKKPLTVSFWVKSNKIGLYTLHLRNSAYTRSFLKAFTINNSDTWEKKVIYVEPNNDDSGYNFESGLGIDFIINLHPDGTSGVEGWNTGTVRTLPGQVTFCDSTSNYFRITNVCVTVGSNVDNFVYYANSFINDHLLNFRYFFNQNSYCSNARFPLFYIQTTNHNVIVGNLVFPVEMRVVPSFNMPDHTTTNSYNAPHYGFRTGSGSLVTNIDLNNVYIEGYITPALDVNARVIRYQGAYNANAEI